VFSDAYCTDLVLERAASVRRHPSSQQSGAPPSCARCGFRSPAASAIPSAITAVANEWEVALHNGTDPALRDAAARLRDEVHVVTNRVVRLVGTSTGVELPPIPGSLGPSRTDDPGQLTALLRIAAVSLAAVLGSLAAQDWERRGRMGHRWVSVLDLALLPLHHSHARLAGVSVCW
jgi:hypothetical protein